MCVIYTISILYVIQNIRVKFNIDIVILLILSPIYLLINLFQIMKTIKIKDYRELVHKEWNKAWNIQDKNQQNIERSYKKDATKDIKALELEIKKQQDLIIEANNNIHDLREKIRDLKDFIK